MISPFLSTTPLKKIPADYCPTGQPLWLSLPVGKDSGKQLFYTDQTMGDDGDLQSLLFVHGNPECSYIFRRTIAALQQRDLPRTRIITLDHIGFGLSSQATRPMTPLDHAENLSQLLAHLAPSKVTLVVHDWGGPIGLGAFLDHPELLHHLVILNSGIFPLAKECNYRNHPFPGLSWQRLSALVPDRFWGTFAARAIASRAGSRTELLLDLLRYPFKRHPASDYDHPYVAQFSSHANVISSKRLAQLAGDWCGVRAGEDPALNAFYRRLQGEVARCWGGAGRRIPARLLAGGWDPLGDQENVRTWLQALPQLEGEMTIFPRTGHFLPETHPAEIAAKIYELLVVPGRSG